MNSPSMQDQKTWYWALVTADAIYHGHLIGVLERDDTPKSARETVAKTVTDIAQKTYGIAVFACIVSDTPQLIHPVMAEEFEILPLDV